SAGVPEGAPLRDCTLDLACTDEERFVDSHSDRTDAPELAIRYPVSFDDWTGEGDPTHGRWVVEPDGRSVVQELNGDPTFFVGPEAYFDAPIEGVWQVGAAGDDDIIGIVFGYQAPVGPEQSSAGDYRMYLLS